MSPEPGSHGDDGLNSWTFTVATQPCKIICTHPKHHSPLSLSLSLSHTHTHTAPPGVPSISYVGVIVEEGSIFVNWTALDDIKNYTLEIRTTHEEDSDDRDDSDDREDSNDSNDEESIQTLVLDTNTHVIPNADFDVVYHFRVKATNDFGSSDFSNVYKFDPESDDDSGHGKRRAGLRGWEIALIVIFILLILLLCCLLWVCVFICWRRENRTYYAAKKGESDSEREREGGKDGGRERGRKGWREREREGEGERDM